MFAPEVEARYKRIEDAQVVTAELLHRFEMEAKDRIGRLEAIQDAMAQWLNQLTAKVDALIDAQIELSRTVDRFLKARTNGGQN